jgi:hypothetical protein
MRVIGLDIHRAFGEAVALEDGRLKRLGRVTVRRDLLEKFAAALSKCDVVVVEATGNAAAVLVHRCVPILSNTPPNQSGCNVKPIKAAHVARGIKAAKFNNIHAVGLAIA